MNVVSEENLFVSFNLMDRNINKQSQICRPHFFNKVVFSVIFKHTFVKFTGV